MKKLGTSLWIGVLMLPFVCQCQNDTAPRPAAGAPATGQADVIVRWHFAGRPAIARDTNATRFKLIDMLAVTADLRAQVAGNFSRAPGKFWEKELPAGVTNGAALLRPLFDDLLQAESYGEVRGPHGRTETALAIELTDERARLWGTNLWQLVSAWKQGQPSAANKDGITGWIVKRSQAPATFTHLRAGKWTILALGSEQPAAAGSWLQQIKSAGRPAPAPTDGELADVQIDSPAFGKWFPLFTDLGLPPLQVTMRGRGEHIRTEARLRYPTPFAWKYEPWQIPTNMLGEPLTSFSVARGVTPLLGRMFNFQELGIGQTPNQICFWGMGGNTNDLCRMYFTVPTPNPADAIKRMALTIPPMLERMLGQCMCDFFYASNRSSIYCGGLPGVRPYLQGLTNAGNRFIHGGIFVNPPNQDGPPELFAALGTRTNLLYYDWEATAFRVSHANQLYQILNIASRRMLQPQTTASKVWLNAIAQELAKDSTNPSQTVTEITQTAPNELTLTRKSHLGFTGFEMATFSAWLDSPAFPFRYQPPKVIPTPKGTNTAAVTNRPAAPKPR